MAEPHDEYVSYIGTWLNYKSALKTFSPSSRFYRDATEDLPRVEACMKELRDILHLQPADDDDMISAIETLLDDGKTTDNFLQIMLCDPYYADIRFNLMTNAAEYQQCGKTVRWSDSDEAASRAYIEKHYGLYQAQKHTDALRLLFKAREYNPVSDLIGKTQWDGEERCEHFLPRWAKCEDSPYSKEVSRLIFAGGIHRLYNPGCKFDDVPILIGTRQGEGKSSIIRWLAVKDEWYGEVTQFEGQQAIEQLYGKWVCEISELLALTRKKEVEASKAFITRTVDSYRRPYDRNTVDLPRRCIYLGTSNNPQPLVDTQNRRWYPIAMRTSGYDLFDHEQECREYILQCWAEAKVKYDRKDRSMQNFAKRELLSVYREQQDAARQDDWREGAIESYLAEKPAGSFVCVRELTRKALAADGFGHDPTVIESKDIGMIMARFPDWEKAGRRYFSEFGQQRAWRKAGDAKEEQYSLPF